MSDNENLNTKFAWIVSFFHHPRSFAGFEVYEVETEAIEAAHEWLHEKAPNNDLYALRGDTGNWIEVHGKTDHKVFIQKELVR